MLAVAGLLVRDMQVVYSVLSRLSADAQNLVDEADSFRRDGFPVDDARAGQTAKREFVQWTSALLRGWPRTGSCLLPMCW